MSIISPILVSEKQSNDQVIFDSLLLQHHYSLEKQCLTLPLPTNYQTEEEDEEDEEDDDDSCDQQLVVGKIRPSISSTRLDITPRANTRVVKNTTSSPAEIVIQPPAIQTYSPQLNLSLYSPSIHSNTLSKATAPLPSPSPSPLASITMDIRSPPQPTQSTSRFRSAFQRLRGSSLSKSSSIVPIELPPLKPAPTKSSSLAEKIKNKFHHHQQEKKKKRESKKSMEKAMPRSSSLSSITNWSRLTSHNSNRSIKTSNNKNVTTSMIHSASMTSGLSSSSSSSSLQQHQKQQYNQNQPKYKEDPRLRQPLRAVNAPSPFNEIESKPKGNVRFAKLVSVRDTYSKDEYNRCSDPDAICNRLTADMAQQIKEELNAYKLHEMPVHEYSRGNTHFFI